MLISAQTDRLRDRSVPLIVRFTIVLGFRADFITVVNIYEKQIWRILNTTSATLHHKTILFEVKHGKKTILPLDEYVSRSARPTQQYVELFLAF